MPTLRPAPSRHRGTDDCSAAVDRFMEDFNDDRRPLLQQLRQAVLAADASISEGIKWKVPSFRTHEYFATTHLRSRVGIGLILHFGAKVRDMPDAATLIDDPDRLLVWLAKDRALIEFADQAVIEARAAALAAILRQWLRHV